MCVCRCKSDPGMPLCFGLSISNLGSTLAFERKHGCQGFQRSRERLRLETEQGKRLALNRERIASLYSRKGYRLDLSGAHLGFMLPLFAMGGMAMMLLWRESRK